VAKGVRPALLSVKTTYHIKQIVMTASKGAEIGSTVTGKSHGLFTFFEKTLKGSRFQL